jgi:hypothetical protein
MSSARTCASSMVYRRRLRAPARADLPVANDTIGITFEKRSSGGGGGGRRRHDTHNRLGATVQRHRAQHAGVCARVRRRRSKESKKDGTKLLRARARERERERERDGTRKGVAGRERYGSKAERAGFPPSVECMKQRATRPDECELKKKQGQGH